MKIFFIFFFVLFSFLVHSCLSNNMIMRTQSMRDGDVIFSQGKRFAFGFFSLGTSKLRYVGIWYAQVSEQTIVWVANRDHPINDTSGHLKFSSRGNLCVYGSVNGTEPIWSTDVLDTISEPALVAKLSDLGNLVLLDPVTGKSFWESFNHPTNTLLPFMKFGYTRQDGVDRFMTSWRSPGDPGFGNVTFRIERRGFPQMMMYKGTTLWWRTGSWTGQRWSGVPEMTNKFIFNISFVNSPDEVSITYGVLNPLVITRMVLNETGTLQRFTWNGKDKKWIGFWSAPEEKCDSYNHCGLNGYCDTTSPDKFECSCLPGHEPKTPQAWNLRDASDGCKRSNAASLCNGREGFAKLKRVKVPNTSGVSVDMNITLKECEKRCLRNCSCVAYASAYHESEDGAKGCLTWHGDMLDTRTYWSAGQDFYLRVDKAELARWNGSGSSGKRRLFLILISMIVVVMLLMIMLFCFIRKRRQVHRHKKPPSTFAPSSFDIEEPFVLEELEDKSRKGELPLFELSTIAAATNNFSFRHKLGAGGFGAVYKGVLENGMEIAVKRLSKNSGQGMEEFKNEVKLISKLQHRNLVRILGCCVESEEKMLIYEYLPNKSLDCFIFREEHRAELDWPKRMGIIRGIARGILYLHQDSRLRIIHRDLKASNVLLDNEMIPKIADFGMARIFGGNQIEGSTNRVVGTYGYMSPEYAMDGHFSIKSDVYSFGVLILEIITGKKNSAIYNENSNLVGQIWGLWQKGEAREIIDTLMDAESYEESEVMKCVHIGLLCVQESASDRPDMSSVVFMLGHNAIDLPSPKHPAFTVGRKRNVKNGGSSGLLIPLNLSIVKVLSERNSLSCCLQFAMASFTTSSSSSSSLLLPKTVVPVSHPTRSHTLSSGIFLTGKWNPMLRSISSTAGSRPGVAIVKAATVDSDYSSRRSSSNEQRETIMLPGCDYNHWLIVMEFPKDPAPTREQMIDTYLNTLATVLGSMEEAKKNMYAFSTTTYTGFQCTIDEETSEKFKGLPGVLWVLPDSYIDVKNKDYGGDKYINGEIIPCTYPTYQPKQRNNSKYQSKRYERKRDGPPPPEQQRKPRQAPPPPASDSS